MPFDASTLRSLELQAQQHNESHAITGYLTYRNERFTQVLEGPRNRVDALMRKIRNDPRHTLTCEVPLTVETRRFPLWSMRLLNPLWLPSGNTLDAIDELLSMAPTSTADIEAVRPSLERLLGEVAKHQ